jgi:hypothetical protein
LSLAKNTTKYYSYALAILSLAKQYVAVFLDSDILMKKDYERGIPASLGSVEVGLASGSGKKGDERFQLVSLRFAEYEPVHFVCPRKP